MSLDLIQDAAECGSAGIKILLSVPEALPTRSNC